MIITYFRKIIQITFAVGIAFLLLPTQAEAHTGGVSKVFENCVTAYLIYSPTKETPDQEDIDLLARLIFCEANTLSDEAQIYTGSVVINRINSELFPDTLEEVVYQSGQYACTDNLYNITPTDRQLEIAEDLLKNGSRIPEEVVFQAEFPQSKGIWKHIANMYFCY